MKSGRGRTGNMLLTQSGRGAVFICHLPFCRESGMASRGVFAGALPRLSFHDNGCSMLFEERWNAFAGLVWPGGQSWKRLPLGLPAQPSSG